MKMISCQARMKRVRIDVPCSRHVSLSLDWHLKKTFCKERNKLEEWKGILPEVVNVGWGI